MMRTLILLNLFRDEMEGNEQCHNRSFYWRTSQNSQSAAQERHPGTVKFHIHPPGEIPPVLVEDGGSFHVQRQKKSSTGNEKRTYGLKRKIHSKPFSWL